MGTIISTLARKHGLPIGKRGGLADPRAPGTDSPRSKIHGDPADRLKRSQPPRVQRPVIGPAFIPGLSRGRAAAKPAKPDARSILQSRVDAENVDRTQRIRRAPRVTLGTSTQSGLDRIRNFAQRPRLPGGRPGLFAKTRRAGTSGTGFGQTVVPAGTTERLAGAAIIAEKTLPVLMPMSEPEQPIVLISSPVDSEQTPQASVPASMVVRAEEGAPDSPGFERMVFLGAALFVAFLAFKGA